MIDLNITTLGKSYESGELSPVEVVEHCVTKIEKHESKLGAFELVLSDRARVAAEAAAKALSSGNRLGPFHGIPFALKDLVDVEGLVTTGGSNAYANRVATETAPIAKRLLAGGGILIGKTKTVEVAYGPWGTNQHRGTPWNPWDMKTHHAPGGSSSGSGSAVSAGVVSCAVGTDTGGSVRIPASFCGLVGLKTTEGRLPLEAIQPLSHTLDTPGPMCRSVEDAAIMYLTMCGEEPRLIDEQQKNRTGTFGVMDRGISGLTFGALTQADRAFLAPEVLNHYVSALERLETLGAKIIEFDLPRSIDDMREGVATLIGTEGYYHHGAAYEDPANSMDTDVKARIMLGKTLSAQAYIHACQTRLADRAAFLRAMKGISAIVSPSTPIPAPVVAEIDQNSVPSQLTRMANHLGFCALSVPMGLTTGGLPTGLQIMARGRHEAVALKIGKAFEADFGAMSYPQL